MPPSSRFDGRQVATAEMPARRAPIEYASQYFPSTGLRSRPVELIPLLRSLLRMVSRCPVRVGDLRPVDDARPVTLRDALVRAPSRRVLAVVCLGTLSLLTAGRVAWHGRAAERSAETQVAASAPAEMSGPEVFPAWVEIPHLKGPLSSGDDAPGASSTIGPRAFPNPADAAEQPIILAPRANPRLPLIGSTPLDATRLAREQLPASDERADRPPSIAATVAVPSAVATLGPDPAQPPRDRDGATTQPMVAAPVPSAVAPPDAAGVPARSVADRPAVAATTVPPPEAVATLGPDPVEPSHDERGSPTRVRDADGMPAPILNREPPRRARSPGPQRPAVAVRRAPEPYRDADQTASITGLPKSTRARADAGAVARASLHRARPERAAVSAPSSGPSPSWTLPRALAPSD